MADSAGRRLATRCRSDFVVVLADADDVGDVVVFFFLFGEEGIVLVVAEIDLVVVLDLGKLVAGALASSSASSSETTSGASSSASSFLLLDLFLFLDDR